MTRRNSARSASLACAACLVLPFVVWAQDPADADTREVSNYRLSEPALAEYAAATRALAPVLANNMQGCDDSGNESLAGLAARLDAVPGASAALSGASMSSREYVVFMLAAFQAGMGAWALTEGQGELPPGFSAENVAFYQAHEAELQELAALLPQDDCGDEGDFGDDEGEWEEAEGNESDG